MQPLPTPARSRTGRKQVQRGKDQVRSARCFRSAGRKRGGCPAPITLIGRLCLEAGHTSERRRPAHSDWPGCHAACPANGPGRGREGLSSGGARTDPIGLPAVGRGRGRACAESRDGLRRVPRAGKGGASPAPAQTGPTRGRVGGAAPLAGAVERGEGAERVAEPARARLGAEGGGPRGGTAAASGGGGGGNRGGDELWGSRPAAAAAASAAAGPEAGAEPGRDGAEEVGVPGAPAGLGKGRSAQEVGAVGRPQGCLLL